MNEKLTHISDYKDTASEYVDMHVHSTMSHDGESTPAEVYERVKELPLAGVCLTEHGDYNPELDHCGEFSYEHYDREISRLEEDMEEDDPLLLRGLEFSEPHLYPGDFQRIQEYDFDVITGAIHWVEGIFVGEDHILDKVNKFDLFRRYFAKVEAMVEFGGIDVVSHLEFPRRYHGGSFYPLEKLRSILEKMVEQGIVLEINTAATEKESKDRFLPTSQLLKIYKRAGGQRVVVGSDAHRVEEIGRSFSRVSKCINDLALEPGYFQGREFTTYRD